MASPNPWWVPDTGNAEPEGRWLGLFNRPLPLKSSNPSLLSIPEARSSVPQRLGCQTAASQAAVLVVEESLATAQVIPIYGTALTSTSSGTITLVGVLGEDSPPVPRTFEETGQDRPEHGVGRHPSLPSASTEEMSLAKRLAFLLQPSAELLSSYSGPLEWHATLLPYQLEGVQELMARDALLLADDMGLGKTVQVVAALRILAVQRRIEAALVVARASLLTQWRQEIRAWAPELRVSTIHGPPTERAYQWSTPAHVYLVTYETLRSDFTQNPASPPRRRTWDVVILDEAQQIKNPKADISRKCKLLPRTRAWALTGTPLENRLDDLASILEFVAPLAQGETPLRLHPDKAMLTRHRQIQLRRKKADVLTQLPPKTTTRILLRLPDSQRESYDMAEQQGVVQLRGMGETVRLQNVLELILRLKQICNFCPRTSQSAKLEDARERIASLASEGHRALIFSQFVDAQYGVTAIASALGEFKALSYTGSLASTQREATIRTFKQDPSRKVLVLSLRAGGLGLNLQEASYVFHFDRWWNPAVEHQAEDRSHRMGQSLPVHVYKYICEGTIEERIDQILQEKQLLFEEVVDDVSIDLKARLTADELFGLFGLTPPKSSGTTDKSSGPPPEYSQMSGSEFEQYVKSLLERRGWTVEMTPQTRDGGIDLKASRAVDIGGDVVLYLQCKNYQSPAGVEVVRQLNGVLPKHEPGSRGAVVCPSGYSADAREFAKDRGIMLWDRHHLFELAQRGASPGGSQHPSPDQVHRTSGVETAKPKEPPPGSDDGSSTTDTLEDRLWAHLRIGGTLPSEVSVSSLGAERPTGMLAQGEPSWAPQEPLTRLDRECGVRDAKDGVLSLPLSWVEANHRPTRVGLRPRGGRLIVTAHYESCPEWRGVKYTADAATIFLPRSWLQETAEVIIAPLGLDLQIARCQGEPTAPDLTGNEPPGKLTPRRIPSAYHAESVHDVESGVLSLPMSWIDANHRPDRVGLKPYGDRLIVTASYERCAEWRGVRYGKAATTIFLPRSWLQATTKISISAQGPDLVLAKLAN